MVMSGTGKPIFAYICLITCHFGLIRTDGRKLCTFDEPSGCSLWNYTSAYHVIANASYLWPANGSAKIIDARPGGKLVQTDCQTPASPMPLAQTNAWISSTSASCALSFDLVILDRARLDSVELILQRDGMRDHLLWSAEDEPDHHITRRSWINHRIVIGHIKERFRIVFESYCAITEATLTEPLLALDNLHFEDCFAGLMKDSACDADKLACLPTGTCLEAGLICDGHVDCEDISDESPTVCGGFPPGAQCDFERDWCQWMLTQPDDVAVPGNSSWTHISAATAPNTGIPADHTTGTREGHFLLLHLPKSRKHDLINQLRSPVFPRIPQRSTPSTVPSGCKVSFYFANSGLTDGNVVLLMEQARANNPARHTIWQLRQRKDDNLSAGWRRVTVPITDVRSRYFLRFVAIPSARGGMFAVDDISLNRACFFLGLNDSTTTFDDDMDNELHAFEEQLQVTNCGKVGRVGPTSTRDCSGKQPHNVVLDTEPAAIQGIQQWRVPVSGVYNVTAMGATGGGRTTSDQATACSGSTVSGIFQFQAGEVVSFAVGQRGEPACSDKDKEPCGSGGGGGGGTFVFKNISTPGRSNVALLLLVAAGGRGHSGGLDGTEYLCPAPKAIHSAEKLNFDGLARMLGLSQDSWPFKCRVPENVHREGGYGGGIPSCGSNGGAGGGLLFPSDHARSTGNQTAVSLINLKTTSVSSFWSSNDAHASKVTVAILCHNCKVACILDRTTGNYYCPSPTTHIDSPVATANPPEKVAYHYVLVALLLAASVAGISICLYFGTRKGAAKCVVRRADCLSCETAELTDAEPIASMRNHQRMEINQLYELNGVRKFDDLRQIARKTIQLKQALGEGAFGIVYQGVLIKSKSEHLPVAVKTLHGTSSLDGETDFAAEALIVSRFHHPNVVQCFGVCFEALPKLIVLELLPGGDVRSFLRRCRTSADSLVVTMLDLLEIAADIAKGCQYLEQHHFVHRDIAARNCLLTSSERPRMAKIADFGMARDVVRSDYYRRNTSVLLPIRWMSPEAIQEGLFSVKSDVWAFGIFLWEIFSIGCSPYAGLNNQEVIHYVCNGGRLSAPSRLCPVELYDLMVQCWARAPLDRRRFSEIIQTLLGLMGVSSVLDAQVPGEKDSPLPLATLSDQTAVTPEGCNLELAVYAGPNQSDFDTSNERENHALDFHSGTPLLPAK